MDVAVLVRSCGPRSIGDDRDRVRGRPAARARGEVAPNMSHRRLARARGVVRDPGGRDRRRRDPLVITWRDLPREKFLM